MTDVERIRRFLAGDPRALEGLVEDYQAPLLKYATALTSSREQAQDVVQEVFLRLVREAPRLPQVQRLSQWLFRVCRNQCLDVVRRETRMQRRHLRAAVSPEVPPQRTPDEQQEERSTVRAVLEDLPEREREVLLLKVVEGFSYREISSITGLSLHQVGTSIHRALRRLATGLRTSGAV